MSALNMYSERRVEKKKVATRVVPVSQPLPRNDWLKSRGVRLMWRDFVRGRTLLKDPG